MLTAESHARSPESSARDRLPALSLESTLADLELHAAQVSTALTGIELSHYLEANPLLPGVILTNPQGQFQGMVSRQRFWQLLSRPYGQELFGKRKIATFHSQLQWPEPLILAGDTPIFTAAHQSLQRSRKELYEPIVVKLAEQQYGLLDYHHLLLAQSQIHELTSQLLQEQTQARLIQTEKMSALGQMVASVAHEILNPVNFICGNISHLSGYGEDILAVVAAYAAQFPQGCPPVDNLKAEIDFDFVLEDFPQVVSSMQLGAERLRKTISALRNFSHMEDTVPKQVNLHTCLDDTLLILHGRLKHTVTVVKQYGSIPEVMGYAGQLSQVFMNIISNAIDALTDASQNSPMDADWQPQIQISTLPLPDDPKHVLVRIEDNGPGIPPDLQAKVFEVFFTTKPVGKGTGLGLAISRQIIQEKHQGLLALWSDVGQGTRFDIVLPLDGSTTQLN